MATYFNDLTQRNAELKSLTGASDLLMGHTQGAVLGAGANIRYSYATPTSPSYLPAEQTIAPTAQTRAVNDKILQHIHAVANVSFVETQMGEAHDITINVHNQHPRFDAFASSADIVIPTYNPTQLGSDSDIYPSYNFLRTLHEFGHVLGLNHPYGNNSNDPNRAHDTLDYSVESYYLDDYAKQQNTAGWTAGSQFHPTSFMMDDLAGLEVLYGPKNDANLGNTVYKWEADTKIWETILDSGGTDTIDASNQKSGVSLNLNGGTLSDIGEKFRTRSDGALGNKHLGIYYKTVIENAIGSAYNDTLLGNDANNVFQGGDGADSIVAGNGDDTIMGQGGNDYIDAGNGNDVVNAGCGTLEPGVTKEHLGNDTIYGGSGVDRLYFDGSRSGVNVNMLTGTSTGGAGTDRFYEFENLALGSFNDTVVGDHANNDIYAGAGNDQVEANGGNDTVYGESGDDTIMGQGGNDRIEAGDGNDVVNAGFGTFDLNTAQEHLGNDTVYGGNGIDMLYFDGARSGVNVNMLTGRATGGAGSDQFYEFENLGMGSFNDTIVGDHASNSIWAGAGNDQIISNGGNDVVYGEHGNDTLMGNDGNDYLSGGDGDDTLNGGFGNGEALTVNEKNGYDTLDGGAGIDTAYFDGHIENMYVNLGLGYADIYFGLGTGKDILISIENIAFGVGNDYFVGDSINNTVWGGVGNDDLSGNGGNDVLYGESGNDTLVGGDGNDLIYGGAGKDLFILSGFGNAHADQIKDFQCSLGEQLEFSKSNFSVFRNGFSLDMFKAVASGSQGTDANDFLVLDKSSGHLYYDADGVNGAASQVVCKLEGSDWQNFNVSNIVVI